MAEHPSIDVVLDQMSRELRAGAPTHERAAEMAQTMRDAALIFRAMRDGSDVYREPGVEVVRNR